MLSRRLSLAVGFALGTLVAGCGDECVEVDLSCQPLYEPTFDNVFSRTLQPTCGTSGTGCHAAEGARAGLVFADADATYARLTGSGGAEALVIPNDPGCSAMIKRTEATSPKESMPPGQQLPAAERCALMLWVANGATR